jgi:molybdopterin synthase sulfur carrier subunit
MTLRITVRFFARHREQVNKSEEIFEVPDGSRVEDLLATLACRDPALEDLSDAVVCAVNKRICGKDAKLNDGDELAILPPVSGG